MRRSISLLVLVLCAPVIAACGESHGSPFDASVDAGEGRDGGTGSGNEDTGPPPPIDAGPRPDAGFRDAGVHPAADVGTPGDGLGGTWTGYIEAYTFPSGSDAVRVVFDSSGTTGLVYFGDGDELPPATDPNVGYPPGLPVGLQGALDYIAEGHGYPFYGAVVSGARVQISVDRITLWSRWCSLQYPVAQGAGAYGCAGESTSFGARDGYCYTVDPDTGEEIHEDCGRLALCGGVAPACQCTATECFRTPLEIPVPFDFHVTGNEASGTVEIEGRHNVYFTR